MRQHACATPNLYILHLVLPAVKTCGEMRPDFETIFPRHAIISLAIQPQSFNICALRQSRVTCDFAIFFRFQVELKGVTHD